MIKNTLVICALTFILLQAQEMNAQVRIGQNKKPAAGALLELNNSEDNTISTKGLGLPRMLLEDRGLLYPMFKPEGVAPGALAWGDYANIGTDTKENINDIHTGLMVYNLGNYDVCDYSTLLAGMYVWNGKKWANLEGKEPEYELGPTVQILNYDNENYYTRDFGPAGRWMTQDLRTRKYDPVRTDNNTIIDDASFLYIKDYKISEANLANNNTADKSYMSNTYQNDNNVETIYMWRAATGGKSGATGLIGPDNDATEYGDKNQKKVQGICPAGWHLPSDYEFTLLENEIIANTHLYSNMEDIKTPLLSTTASYEPAINATAIPSVWIGAKHGKAMRDACNIFDGNKGDAVRGNSLRARYGGFDGTLTGFTYTDHTPRHTAFYWTSSSSRYTGATTNKTHAIARRIDTRIVDFDVNDVDRGIKDRRNLFSVRCVKDRTNDSNDN